MSPQSQRSRANAMRVALIVVGLLMVLGAILWDAVHILLPGGVVLIIMGTFYLIRAERQS